MDDKSAWLILFAGLVSIKAHPRNGGELDLRECERLADNAFVIYKDKCKDFLEKL